jgi:hypothetical protein
MHRIVAIKLAAFQAKRRELPRKRDTVRIQRDSRRESEPLKEILPIHRVELDRVAAIPAAPLKDVRHRAVVVPEVVACYADRDH